VYAVRLLGVREQLADLRWPGHVAIVPAATDADRTGSPPRSALGLDPKNVGELGDHA
jgi:hypothetical protein